MTPDVPEDMRQAARERGLNIFETTSTWLVIGHLGALAFLYNAVLSGHVPFDEPQRKLALIFIFGAITAFTSKTTAGMFLVNGTWPYRQHFYWAAFVASGVGLAIGLCAPIMYQMVTHP